MPRVRLAEDGDAEAIARIQVEAWRAAYTRILPSGFLAGLVASERAAQWARRIGTAADPGAPTYVAVDSTGTVQGFAHTGAPRDDDVDREQFAEIYTLYVDPAAWRRGIGSSLLAAVDDFWAPAKVSELVLWVFHENLAGRAFYERLGWSPDGRTQVDDFGGARPVEVRYRRSVRADQQR